MVLSRVCHVYVAISWPHRVNLEIWATQPGCAAGIGTTLHELTRSRLGAGHDLRRRRPCQRTYASGCPHVAASARHRFNVHPRQRSASARANQAPRQGKRARMDRSFNLECGHGCAHTSACRILRFRRRRSILHRSIRASFSADGRVRRQSRELALSRPCSLFLKSWSCTCQQSRHHRGNASIR